MTNALACPLAEGRLIRQDTEACAADDRLAAGLAEALAAAPVADAGHRVRAPRQQGGER